jgi:hypothetical protein
MCGEGENPRRRIKAFGAPVVNVWNSTNRIAQIHSSGLAIERSSILTVANEQEPGLWLISQHKRSGAQQIERTLLPYETRKEENRGVFGFPAFDLRKAPVDDILNDPNLATDVRDSILELMLLDLGEHADTIYALKYDLREVPERPRARSDLLWAAMDLKEDGNAEPLRNQHQRRVA